MDLKLDGEAIRKQFEELCRQKQLSPEVPQPPWYRRSSKCGVTSERCRVEGNEKFNKREFRVAISFYNGCLRYAPPGSKNIPLAYGNRSAVYCEMGKYALAMQNIELARKHGFPAEKMMQLDVREEKCKKLMETFGPDKEFEVDSFLKLSHPPNKKIPFIVECLELRKSKKYGRHVATTKDLKAGDIIAIETPVFAWRNELLDITCAFCTETKFGSLIPCFHCSRMMYCSEECNRKDVVHLNEGFSKNGYGPSLRSASKMLLESFRVAGGVEQLLELLKDSEDKTIFDFDFSNPGDPSYEKNMLIALNGLWRLDKLHDVDEIKPDQLLNIPPINEKPRTAEQRKQLLKLLLDQHKIYNSNVSFCQGSHHRAFLLKPLLSHSCIPNTVCYQFGRKSALFVIRTIKSGEQITCSYGPDASCHSKKERQQHLREIFSFKCDCEACINNWSRPFPRKDWSFVQPDFKVKLSSTEAIEQIRKNFSYVDENNKNMPCFEFLGVLMHNTILIQTMGGTVG